MALARTLGFGVGKRRKNPNAGLARPPAPYLPNVAGHRYVRDEGRKGIVAKLVRR